MVNHGFVSKLEDLCPLPLPPCSKDKLKQMLTGTKPKKRASLSVSARLSAKLALPKPESKPKR